MSDDRFRIDHVYKEEFPPDKRIEVQYQQLRFLWEIWPLLSIGFAAVATVLLLLTILLGEPQLLRVLALGLPRTYHDELVMDKLVVAIPMMAGLVVFVAVAGRPIIAFCLRYYRSVYPWLRKH